MKKKLGILLMVLIMVLSTTVTSYAAIGTGDEIMPQATHIVSFSTTRTSGTTAHTAVSITFTGIVDQYSVVIYLQKLVNGSWVNDTTNEDYVLYNNGFNDSSFLGGNNYTDLTYGTTYRLMVVSRDVINGKENRETVYSDTF